MYLNNLPDITMIEHNSAAFRAAIDELRPELAQRDHLRAAFMKEEILTPCGRYMSPSAHVPIRNLD